MFKKLFLSLIVIVPTVAQADWVQIEKSNEYITYLDPERTIATSQSLKYAEAWLKMVIHTDLSKDGLTIGDYKLFKYKFKCDSKEFGLAAAYTYKSSKLLNSYVPRYVEYESAIPDTKGELITNVVCKFLYDNE